MILITIMVTMMSGDAGDVGSHAEDGDGDVNAEPTVLR